MTLATLTDKERAQLLRDIASTLGLDPDRVSAEQLFSVIAEAHRRDAESRWGAMKLGPH